MQTVAGSNLREQANASYSGPLQVTEDTVLTPADRYVNVVTNAALTITLPPVGECQGMIFTVWVQTASSDNVTIQATGADVAGDAPAFVPAVVLTTTGDHAAFISDGLHWFCILLHVGGVREPQDS